MITGVSYRRFSSWLFLLITVNSCLNASLTVHFHRLDSGRAQIKDKLWWAGLGSAFDLKSRSFLQIIHFLRKQYSDNCTSTHLLQIDLQWKLIGKELVSNKAYLVSKYITYHLNPWYSQPANCSIVPACQGSILITTDHFIVTTSLMADSEWCVYFEFFFCSINDRKLSNEHVIFANDTVTRFFYSQTFSTSTNI